MTETVRPVWKKSPTSDSDGMSLPEGRTCGDCAKFSMCHRLIAVNPLNEVCDWSPSRFVPAAQAVAKP